MSSNVDIMVKMFDAVKSTIRRAWSDPGKVDPSRLAEPKPPIHTPIKTLQQEAEDKRNGEIAMEGAATQARNPTVGEETTFVGSRSRILDTDPAAKERDREIAKYLERLQDQGHAPEGPMSHLSTHGGHTFAVFSGGKGKRPIEIVIPDEQDREAAVSLPTAEQTLEGQVAKAQEASEEQEETHTSVEGEDQSQSSNEAEASGPNPEAETEASPRPEAPDVPSSENKG